MYKDKDSLISGTVTSFAQEALDDGKTITLPGQTDLVGTEESTGEAIEIDSSAIDSKGKLNTDKLSASKPKKEVAKAKIADKKAEKQP